METVKQTFTIDGRLPGLNDLILANRKNKFAGAKLKKETQNRIVAAIRASGIKPIAGAFEIEVLFVEPNQRRDPDNIYSGIKYILDALQQAGIVGGDSQKYLHAPEPIKYRYGVGAPTVYVYLTGRIGNERTKED